MASYAVFAVLVHIKIADRVEVDVHLKGKRVSGPTVDTKCNSRKTRRVPQSGDATASPFAANARRGIKR
jgi:hypothetical protein